MGERGWSGDWGDDGMASCFAGDCMGHSPYRDGARMVTKGL